VYLWDHAGVANLYVANADGHGLPQALTSFRKAKCRERSGAATHKRSTFRMTAICGRRQIAGGAAKPVWTTAARETDIVPSPDATRVAFVRHAVGAADGTPHKSDLIVRWLAEGSESVVAQDDVSISRPMWSPSGASLAYTAGFKTINHDENTRLFRR